MLDKKPPAEHHVHRTGDWLPGDHRAQQDYLKKIDGHVQRKGKKMHELHPVLVEFKEMIESDTHLYLLFNSMFEEIPQKKPYFNDPSGKKQVRSFEHMLQMLDHILTTPPDWNSVAEEYHTIGLPINAILDWAMGTPSGYAAFLNPKVNAGFKKVLDQWGTYLASPDSARHLGTNDDDWFGKTGLSHLTKVANRGDTNLKFEELFVCDPKAKYHGYTSWDDFFTRKFRFEDGIRPIASPEDDNVVANSCESKTYKVATNVKARDHFWAKKQPYSVNDMLAHDKLAEQFVGGTVYQAFLSALSYHRWHSPVSGKIVKAVVVPGTYFAETLHNGLGDPKVHEIDPQGEASCQGFISSTATRGIIFIEADNPKIGLMACIYIGMSEVSTSEIYVKEGDRVKKGDVWGSFHFGGSTHCIMFRKGVEVEGLPQPGQDENVAVRSELCRVV